MTRSGIKGSHLNLQQQQLLRASGTCALASSERASPDLTMPPSPPQTPAFVCLCDTRQPAHHFCRPTASPDQQQLHISCDTLFLCAILP